MPAFESVADLVRSHHPEADKIRILTRDDAGVKREVTIIDGREEFVPQYYNCGKCGVVEGYPIDREGLHEDSRYKTLRSYCKMCGAAINSKTIKSNI